MNNANDLVARWVVTAELQLLTATHLGTGEPGHGDDLALLRDRVDHRPLLTGSSLAGALRGYLNDRWLGYGVEEPAQAVVARLLGGPRGDAENSPSPLIVFDSRGAWPDKATSEIRQGVTLHTERGTVEDPFHHDLEVLPPGTTFLPRFDLILDWTMDEGALLSILAAALVGLERGEIAIGARRSRGSGACRAVKWRARRFDLTTRDGWLAWLTSDHEHPNRGLKSVRDPIAALTNAAKGLKLEAAPDLRERVVVEADLHFKAGLLVRDPSLTTRSPDAVQFQSDGHPILPGTSVAGALRTRAARIARAVRSDPGDADQWVDRLFGSRPGTGKTSPSFASRLLVAEARIDDGLSLRQTRIRGDRFTGGVVDDGQFDEEPIFRGRVNVRLELRRPRLGEIGLLLLIVKDLLTGDLPLGGGNAVGRGVVVGRAEVFLPGHPQPVRLDHLLAAPPEVVAQLNTLVAEFRTAAAASEGT